MTRMIHLGASGVQRRRNGEVPAAAAEAAGARRLFEKFHQKPASGHRDYAIPNNKPRHLALLGTVLELHVKAPRGKFILKPRGVKLASTPEGTQMYFIGGDQGSVPLDAMGAVGDKDHVKLGPLTMLRYLTQKGFHNFQSIDYGHRMGEDGGEAPDLCFDRRNKLLYLVGGTYVVKRPGIVR